MRGIKRWRGLLFVLPSLLGVVIFYIIPFFQSMLYCFTRGVANRKFVGLDNFVLLFKDKIYRLAVTNTLLITGIALPLLCVLAVVMAFVIETNLKKYRFLQGWLLIPMAIPVASMVLVWKDLFTKDGIVNGILHTNMNWLENGYAPLVVITMIIWKNLGYDVLLVISSLLTLPKDYEEAASLEGAGSIKIALKVKLPQLVPMLFFTVIISLFNCFKIFREVYLLYGGNYPTKSVYLLQHFMSNNFDKLDYEMLATAAFMLYICIFMIIFFLTKWQQNYIKNN